MSKKSLIEIDHRYIPGTCEEKKRFVECLCEYMISDDERLLPDGVKLKGVYSQLPRPKGQSL